jgi:carbonic anhydrase
VRQAFTDECVSFEETLREDIEILRTSPWIKKETRIFGLKYDTHKGTIEYVDDYKPEGWPDLADRFPSE